MYDYEEFRLKANAISLEHKEAIDAAEGIGKELAEADLRYHKRMTIVIPQVKAQYGATVAEAMAKGEEDVAVLIEERDILRAKERAAIERIRLARDDRATLLLMGRWSREYDE